MYTEELQLAKNLLLDGQHTCVVLLKTERWVSDERGVKPLLTLLNSDMDTTNAFVADKVVGKAAAFLYVAMQVKALFAITVSKPALDVLDGAGIYVEYENLTPAIKNRTNTGYCPMESAVWDIQDAQEARTKLERICEFKVEL